MSTARYGVLALLASTALLSSCATDTTAPSAMAQGSAVNASATTPANVDNFMLVDAGLEAHELYRLSDAPAVVIVTQANGDPAIRAAAPALKTLAASYGAKGVEFLLLNSNLKDRREAILAEADKVGFGVPILLDVNQLVGESLGVARSAEAFVINPKTWQVVYRGPVAGVGPALDALAAGQPIPASNAALTGMPIAFPERGAGAKLTYVKDVAPILEAKCVACHQEGGIGPFAMTNYEMVKGFSPMIREVIRTDRMPPYNADPHVGKFSDDKNLSPAEIKTLVHWIEAGAPRGEGTDPLGAVKHVAAEWPLGKPDMVIDIPAFKVPASGVVDYQRPAIANTLTEGKWIRATTVKPGDRQSVHHVLTGWMSEMPANGQSSETRWKGSVGGYAVGAESNIYASNVGSYLPAGGAIGFQMHYTPYGKEAVDNSKIGVYFYDKPPELMMRSVVVIDPTITIAANAGRHKEVAYVEFPNDALLYSAFPHAHYRAYSNDLWLQTPDGKKTLLLSLPRYDFNWQRAYTFEKPIRIPAGSRIIANYVYDNSKRNPANPDPTIKVTWGEQSHEEMLFTQLSFRWLDETAAKQVDSDARFAPTRLMGMMDDNLDGKLQKAEAKGQLGTMIATYFDRIDTSKDGALDKAELAAAQALLPGRRRGSAEASNAPAQPTGGR
ncbi:MULTISPECIES: redoxin domain-containing protein [unclassified Phenylobacterium]|uniref:redoxin domain-containing protein n=1 Tax=unclassified Phenylobacterium TaxID=2640670 RepID=UPI00083A7B9D|nr:MULTISPECIES: redoxin domain-containing protein [unclassified Phenylobacterium]